MSDIDTLKRAFILARVVEDESIAEGVIQRRPWRTGGSRVVGCLRLATGHVAVSPVRWGMECDTKRLIAEHGTAEMVEQVARIWADHPDYPR